MTTTTTTLAHERQVAARNGSSIETHGGDNMPESALLHTYFARSAKRAAV